MKGITIHIFLCLTIILSGCVAHKNYQSSAVKEDAILVKMADTKEAMADEMPIDQPALKQKLRLVSGYFHNRTDYGRALRDLRDQDILEEKFADKLKQFLLPNGSLDPTPETNCPDINQSDFFYLVADILDYQKIEMSHDFRFSATKKQIIKIEIDAALYSCADHQIIAHVRDIYKYNQSHSAILSIDLGPDQTQNRSADVIQKSVDQTLYALSQNKQ